MRNGIHFFIAVLAMTVMTLLTPSNAYASETEEIEDIVNLKITEENGFIHPGISVDPEQLEISRQQLIEGNETYLGYYKAMKETAAAEKQFKSSNLVEGTLHDPAVTSYDNASQTVRLSQDSFKAYTQSILYYLTGDSTYRYNAIRLIRIWSNLDAEKFNYFPDAHIHVAVPVYYLVSAAEMIKYTEPLDQTFSNEDVKDYDLNWTKEDNQRLIENLIDPAQKTFYNRNDYYMNQHLYATTGVILTAIFKNDQAMYEEAVEWFTVNKDTDRPERNGSLIHQYSLIEANQQGNPIGQDYIQHLEMGRDNAHSSGDVLNMIGLARILTQQKTRIDPTEGTVSTNEDATTIYEFLNNRLLEGTEQWAKYMVGQTIPWTKTGNGMDFGGEISPAYRGRTGLYYSSTELYDMYRYKIGMSDSEIEEKAPMIAHMAKNQAAPVFYSFDKKNNFWGSHSDNKMTEIGAEYWLSMPLDRANEPELSVPATQGNPEVNVTVRGTLLDETHTKLNTENGKQFFTTKAVPTIQDLKETAYDKSYPKDTSTIRGGNHFSVASLGKTANMAIRYRSNGESRLNLSSSNDYSDPYQVIVLPNTEGEWKTVVYSTEEGVDTKAQNLSNIDFYAVLSDQEVTVDFEWVNYVNTANDGIKGTIPKFAKDTSKARHIIKGQIASFNIDIVDGEGANIFLGDNSEGIQLEDAKLTIDSNNMALGKRNIVIGMENDQFIRGETIHLNVYPDRQTAFDEAMKEFDSNQIYTSSSKTTFLETMEEVEKAIDEKYSDEEFMEAYEAFTQAQADLELLNPLVEDGSFDYAAYSSILPNNSNLHVLLDNDDATFSGDLKNPYYLDFGSEYRMTVNSFQMQTRRGFPNRYQGFNIYGSEDNKTWTLLTENSTTFTEEMETLHVKEEYKNTFYRYFMLRVDNPGTPTDPAYPNISSFSELRIFGERHEVNHKITRVEMKNSGIKNMILPGEEVKLEIEAIENISNLEVEIDQVKAEVKENGDLNWIASITYPEGEDFGSDISVKVDYLDADGNPGATLFETTDKKEFYKSSNARLIKDALARVYKTSSGSPKDVSAWFDGDSSTMSEFRKEQNGETYVQFDFSDKPIVIDRIEFLARQDEYSKRAEAFQFQVSQDGVLWEDAAPRGKNTKDWQSFIPDSNHRGIAYKYVRIYMWANFLGISEMRILGEQQ